MDINIVGQYQNLLKGQEKLRKMLKKNEQNILLLKKYLQHAEDVRLARKEKKLIPMEKVFRELGI